MISPQPTHARSADAADGTDGDAPMPEAVLHLQAIRALAALLAGDDLDAAIEAGLMSGVPCPRCVVAVPEAAALIATIGDARQRLATAWAARHRHRARERRLALRRAARAKARIAAAPSPQARPALPPAAALALARAKARAAKPSA